jgi:hypothetical protein
MMTYRVLIHKEASLSAAMEYVRYISELARQSLLNKALT